VARLLAEAVAGGDPVVFSELGCPLDGLDLAAHDAWHQEPHAGGLGWALPAAMGFKLGQPERLVIATMGDGSYVFANPVACHQTALALDLAILIVVLNDAGYGAVRQSVLGLYPDGAAARANAMPLVGFEPAPDLAAVARAGGASARRVDKAADLREALADALEHMRTHRTCALVDVAIAA